MSTTDQMTAKIRAAGPLGGGRAREIARHVLWRFAPAYARRRARRVGTAVAVERLEADFERMRKRHTEQIERLEDLARELVQTVESLRREIARGERGDEV